MKKILKIKIFQPDANYRLPFSFSTRFTYPIPPFSTVKGLICNLLGIKTPEEYKNKKIDDLSMAMYGNYESLIKEYVWFRNLDKDSHKKKYILEDNRFSDGEVGHIGGQIPLKVDVLHNLNLIIYLYHPDIELLEEINSGIKNPINRNTILHLGRAEDLLVFKETEMIILEDKHKQSVRKIPYFLWIPTEQNIDTELLSDSNLEKYKNFYEKLSGNYFQLPWNYKIEDNKRIFENYIRVKLYEKFNFEKTEFYVDSDGNIPLIFTKLKEE
jgi:CRISPR-associated protein Cas5t